MYTHNLNPIILSIGSIDIRWYSLFYLIGFALLYFSLSYFSKKGAISGLDGDKLEKFVIYSILGVILGGRVGYFLFYDISQLLSLELFQIWNGGMSFHGAFIGFLISTFMFSRKNKVNFVGLLNISAISIAFSLILGRIGNFINGRLVGIPFDGAWCVVFPGFDTVCRHPYPIYAAISHLLLFGYLVLLVYLNRKRLKEFFGKMTITANFFIGYGVLRIITDIWKVDNSLLGIKTGQWLSVAMIIIGIILLRKRKK